MNKLLTVEDVKTRVEGIRDMSGDPEQSHSAEDSLYRDVLLAISLGMSARRAAELADAALESRKIDFPRWCG